MKGFLLTTAILVICISCMWALNGVDDDFSLANILDYCEKLPPARNQVVETFNEYKEVYNAISKVGNGLNEIIERWYEMPDGTRIGKNFLQVFVTGAWFIIEAFILCITIAIYAVPFFLGLIYDAMYYARIVAYIVFGISL